MNEALKKLRSMQQSDLKKMAKDHQEAQTDGGFTSFGDYEEIKFSPLEIDKTKRLKFYRIVGWPIHLRHEDPQYSPKVVMISRIIDDRGKWRRFILPTREENNNHILYKLIDKVLEGPYNQDTKTKSYTHVASHPEVFKHIFANSKEGTYQNGWKPTQYVVMNVIDREMMAWHKENKHTVIVSKKANIDKSDSEKVYYEPGTTMAMYNAITGDDVGGAYGYPLNYDVVIKKLSELPWYKAYHSKDFMSYAGAQYESEEAFKVDYPFYDPEMHVRLNTEEEDSWEMFDIEKLYKVSSYQKINNALKGWVKKFDSEFGQNLSQELQNLANEEKKAYKETEQENETSVSTPVEAASIPIEVTPATIVTSKQGVPELPVQSTSVPIAPVVQEEVPTRSRQPVGFDLASLTNEGFIAIGKLTEEEKATVTGYDNEKGTLIYNIEGPTYKCTSENCTNNTPEFFHLCPKCGVTF